MGEPKEVREGVDYERLLRLPSEERAAAYRDLYGEALRESASHQDGLVREARRGWRRRFLPAALRARSLPGIVGRCEGALLELGCGEGGLAFEFARRCRRVVGLDVAAPAIERARANAAALGARNVSFVVGDAVAPGLRPQSFDWVSSHDLVEHFHPDDVPRHFASVRSLLRPGGRYLVSTPNRLGHHRPRAGHLILFSHGDLEERLLEAGFFRVETPWFRTDRLVPIRHKIVLEETWARRGWRRGLGGLGVRAAMAVALRGEDSRS